MAKKPKDIKATIKSMTPNVLQRRPGGTGGIKKPMMKSSGSGKKPKGC